MNFTERISEYPKMLATKVYMNGTHCLYAAATAVCSSFSALPSKMLIYKTERGRIYYNPAISNMELCMGKTKAGN
jgi:hypothetical protein